MNIIFGMLLIASGVGFAFNDNGRGYGHRRSD